MVSPSFWLPVDHSPVEIILNTQLLTAAEFHDVGLFPAHSSSLRFKVDGADAARDFLARHGVDLSDIGRV